MVRYAVPAGEGFRAGGAVVSASGGSRLANLSSRQNRNNNSSASRQTPCARGRWARFAPRSGGAFPPRPRPTPAVPAPRPRVASPGRGSGGRPGAPGPEGQVTRSFPAAGSSRVRGSRGDGRGRQEVARPSLLPSPAPLVHRLSRQDPGFRSGSRGRRRYPSGPLSAPLPRWLPNRPPQTTSIGSPQGPCRSWARTPPSPLPHQKGCPSPPDVAASPAVAFRSRLAKRNATRSAGVALTGWGTSTSFRQPGHSTILPASHRGSRAAADNQDRCSTKSAFCRPRNSQSGWTGPSYSRRWPRVRVLLLLGCLSLCPDARLTRGSSPFML